MSARQQPAEGKEHNKQCGGDAQGRHARNLKSMPTDIGPSGRL
jgi:hypothetical protein